MPRTNPSISFKCMNSLVSHKWITNKIHISWHIAAFSLGILIGTVFIATNAITLNDSEWLFITISGMITTSISRMRYLLILALLSGMILGAWRSSGEEQALSAYQPYYQKQVTVYGTVAEDASFGAKGDQRFKLKSIAVEDTRLAGTVWVSVSKGLDVKRGDSVRVSGILRKGFGTISASIFRGQVLSIERSTPGDIGRRVRDWFAVGVYRSMPEDSAQLALAFLVGQKLTVSETLADQLRTVGLIHAVVASGYHLTILVGVVRRLFVRVSKYLTFVFSATMIGGFIMITGFSPSMTRAGLVTTLGLIAWYYGRVIHPLVLLPLAAAVTVLYQPEYIWGDVGWYLSFAAFTGVLLLAPLINHYFWGDQVESGILKEVLIATVAAQILTLPISIYVFGYYSAYALLANMLVVPLIPLTMLLTFVTGVVGLMTTPALAQLTGFPTVLLLEYMIKVVDWIARLPSAKSEVQIGLTGVMIGYILIAAVTVFLWQQTKHDFRKQSENQKLF